MRLRGLGLLVHVLCVAVFLAVARGDHDCLDYRKLSDGVCAHQCIPPMVGPCPRTIPVFFGRLEAGRCPEAGYPFFVRNVSILAGPCGTMEFALFSGATQKESAGRAGRAGRALRVHSGVGGGVHTARWPRFHRLPRRVSP